MDTNQTPRIIGVRVPGKVFDECFDPMATDVQKEEGWPKPSRIQIGRGWQFRYRVTEAQARDMLEWGQEFGEAHSFGVDDPSIGRFVLRWVTRERERLGLYNLS